MGLRDRLSANYYIPLVAGVDSAARSGVLAPPNVYAPGLGAGGSGSLDGIGAGAGGNETPDDPTISKPTITAPASGATGVSMLATATATAFDSTNAQTHLKSRWVIEYRGDPANTDISGVVMYDSGPITTSLESLDMTVANLGAHKTYAIKVRYMGSGGGWSPWSDYDVFTTGDCPPTYGSVTFDNEYSFTYDGSTTGVAHTSPITPPPDIAGWTNVKVYVREAYWDDRGYVEGNAQHLEPAYDGTNSVQYTGPVTLIANGTADPITVSTTNVYTPACSVLVKVRWIGDAPDGGTTCVSMPPADPAPPPPPPPVFVPPPPPPDPYVPPIGTPPSQGSYAHICIDGYNSFLQGTNPADQNGVKTATLGKVLADGGFNVYGTQVYLTLLLQNTGNAPGSINVGVSADASNVRVDLGSLFAFVMQDQTPTDSSSVLVSFTVPAKTTRSLIFVVDIGDTIDVSHTINIDIGDGNPLEVKLGFTQQSSGPWI